MISNLHSEKIQSRTDPLIIRKSKLSSLNFYLRRCSATLMERVCFHVEGNSVSLPNDRETPLPPPNQHFLCTFVFHVSKLRGEGCHLYFSRDWKDETESRRYRNIGAGEEDEVAKCDITFRQIRLHYIFLFSRNRETRSRIADTSDEYKKLYLHYRLPRVFLPSFLPTF